MNNLPCMLFLAISFDIELSKSKGVAIDTDGADNWRRTTPGLGIFEMFYQNI